MSTTAIHRTEMRAGGTDLNERRRSGVSRGVVTDLERAEDMLGIDWGADGAARIGALVTIETLAADARVLQAYPGFAAAAAGLATPQIRAIATLGGNLAQRTRCWYFRNPHFSCLKKEGPACPARNGNHLYGAAFDLGPCVWPHPSTLGAALLAQDAMVATDSRGRLSAAEFFGDGTDGTADNTLAAGERILGVAMGVPLARERGAYRRAISRSHAEWPLVEIVARIVVTGGRFQLARIAAGGIAPVPLRLPEVEDALTAGSADQRTIRQAVELTGRGRNTLAQTRYKLDLLRELTADVLTQAIG